MIMNTGLGTSTDSFFGTRHSPRRIIQKKVDTVESTPPDIQAMVKFFDKDLATLLGQGPIKRIPKMNKKPVVEEPLTAEMAAEIKEVF